MTLTLTMIQTLAYDKMLNSRNLSYVVNTPQFEAAYKEADESQRELFHSFVAGGSVQHIKDLIRTILKDTLESKGVRDLRVIARRKGVHGVSRLSREQLIFLIKERTKQNEETRKDQPDS